MESLSYNKPIPEELKNDTQSPITISKKIKIILSAKKGSILIISDSSNQKENHNPQLIRAIVKSFYWNNLLLSGEVKSSVDIQKMEGLSDNANIKDILKLRFLAPCIIERILNGTQPTDWCVKKLVSIKTLIWQEQKELLNF